VNEPFIWSAWGSHWYVYVPPTNVSVQVTPAGGVVSVTPVAMFTPPGPVRWKL
jgi:hypothetical protein